jgi:hypothetical protein
MARELAQLADGERQVLEAASVVGEEFTLADEGIAEMRHGLEVYQRTGARVGRAQKLLALSEAYANAGRYGEALDALTEAHPFCEATGELYCDAELVRVKGAIIRRQRLAASPRPRSGQKGRVTASARREHTSQRPLGKRRHVFAGHSKSRGDKRPGRGSCARR